MPGSPRTCCRAVLPLLLPLLPPIAAALLPGCGKGKEGPPPPPPLHIYVGGTMRPALEEIARQYEKESGEPLELDYADSGACAIKAETTGKGDLCVVHDPFHDVLAAKGLLGAGGRVAAAVEPAIGVAKGNPRGIRGLKDLARPGLRVILTDLKYSTAGPVAQAMFQKAGIEAEVEKNVVTRTRSGGEAANAVVLGNADATVVWSAVIHLRRDQIEAVPIEMEFLPVPGAGTVAAEGVGAIDPGRIRVTVDVLKSSARPEAAKAFADFAASPRIAEVWRSFGFGPPPAEGRTPDGAAAPAGKKARTLLLHCGAGLRPPVDEIAEVFAARSGVAVERDYAGSGVLLARLRLVPGGDLFFPGDESYVEVAEKEGLVIEKKTACYLVPVILVPRGNPKKIAGLEDLLRPGIRLGLGNAEACQIGRASEKIIARNRLDAAAVQKNLVFSSATVSELALQVQTGHLDACLVWDAVAAQVEKDADAVPIPREKNEPSPAAIAVLKASKDPAAAADFLRFATGPEGRAIFVKHRYRVDPP